MGKPWHMTTSSPQYLLMVPSYISVLNVYAFANVHDVSWGTKGDNKISTDLGVLNTSPDINEAKVAVPTTVDAVEAYADAVRVLSTKPPKTKEKLDPQTQQEDYYRRFRTHVLLGWTLSNALLAAIIVTATGKAADQDAHNTVNGYMAFILFSIAGLALIRFVGAATYMLLGFFSGDF